MSSASESPHRSKRSEILRWLCVLPAAILAQLAVRYAVGVVAQSAGWRTDNDLSPSSLVLLFLAYALPAVAFVIAGAKTAPRYVMATSIGLALLGLLLSLMTHLVGQHLAGNRVGIVNYMHFFAESAGFLAGATVLALGTRKNRPTKTAT